MITGYTSCGKRVDFNSLLTVVIKDKVWEVGEQTSPAGGMDTIVIVVCCPCCNKQMITSQISWLDFSHGNNLIRCENCKKDTIRIPKKILSFACKREESRKQRDREYRLRVGGYGGPAY